MANCDSLFLENSYQKKKKTDGKQYDRMLKVLILDDRNKGVCCFILCVFLYLKYSSRNVKTSKIQISSQGSQDRSFTFFFLIKLSPF